MSNSQVQKFLIRCYNSFLKSLQQKLPHTKISKPTYKYTMKKLPLSDCLCGGIKARVPKKRVSKPRPTSAHVKATWASKVSLANQIPPLIKSYQGPIPPISCKFHFKCPVINPKTGFSPTITINH
jgi:hypothetical protein